MTTFYDQFATDGDAESQGVWLDYGSAGRVRVARAGGSNVRFTRRLEAFGKKYKRQIELEILDDSVAEKELIQIYADTVILGWEDVKGRDGKDLPFSKPNVVQLLTDLPELFRDIREQSTRLALFRELEDGEAAGN